MSKRFRKWWQSTGVVLTVDLIIRNGLLPLLRLINSKLLPEAEVPLVSLTNLWRIINQHPGVVLVLLTELLLVWWVLLLLFTLMLIGIVQINQGTFSLTNMIAQLLTVMKRLNGRIQLLLLAELITWLPLFSIAFRTPLLIGMRVPEVILDYGTRNGWLMATTLLIYAGCFVVTMRFIGTITKLVLIPKAQLRSNQVPLGQFWRELLIAGTISWLLNGALLIVQRMIGSNQRGLSIVCLTIAEVGSLLVFSWVIVHWVQIVMGSQSGGWRNQNYAWNGWTLLMLVVLLIETGMSSIHYFQPQCLTRPVTIAHRGVANHNGVQNSIEALRRTSHNYHPDYVEMDIHETKDHQFVVMHDENLHQLTRVNLRPNQLTLHQLTHLTMRENGHTAKISSFDQYLRAAQQLHQKLIVELKTTQDDSPDVVERFNRQYGKLIVQRHYLVHSLDYGLVTQLQRLNPQMEVLYLQAYNFTNPQPKIKGFNNEYSSLNERFINAVHRQGKPIYAWTVNNRGAMKQLINQHVDGIVTDDLPQLQQIIRQTMRHQNDAERYWNYLNPIVNLPT
ncbi:glycerophosphodiester phosphodiesterase [uncultured Limosilactobacillus sp.]|uniref:glycerophosphodiester phosphodiesterase n=1 Tax=uncultured Limosilactobacillus sp. TaxID=2837629 RepID=UPI0025CBBB70|nr:glycerophosphodiester phosphodiesterase [uncultured Limosilactobacillus sp.]